MKKIKRYEIINHGYMYPDYFQGCGISFTEFTDVATGCGTNAAEAYADACESLAQNDWEGFPNRPKGIRASDRVPAKYTESYWYVSVRVA